MKKLRLKSVFYLSFLLLIVQKYRDYFDCVADL